MAEKLLGTVTGVYAGPTGVITSKKVDGKLRVFWNGVEHDRHSGRTMLAGVREVLVPRGTEVLNLRQVVIVAVEELALIAQGLGINKDLPEDLGANIALRDIPDLTTLPIGTHLEFPGQAILYVTGVVKPCGHPGTAIQMREPGRGDLAQRFKRNAKGRRGIAAMVYRPGIIRKGDEVMAHLP